MKQPTRPTVSVSFTHLQSSSLSANQLNCSVGPSTQSSVTNRNQRRSTESDNKFQEKVVVVNGMTFIAAKDCNKYEDRAPRYIIQLNRSKSKSLKNLNTGQCSSVHDKNHSTSTVIPNIIIPPMHLQKTPRNTHTPSHSRNPTPSHTPSPSPSHQHHQHKLQPSPSLISTEVSQKQRQGPESTLQRLQMKIAILERRVTDLHQENQAMSVKFKRRLEEKEARERELEENLRFLMDKNDIKEREVEGLWKMIDEIRAERTHQPKSKETSTTTQHFINLALSEEIDNIKDLNQQLERQVSMLKSQNSRLISLISTPSDTPTDSVPVDNSSPVVTPSGQKQGSTGSSQHPTQAQLDLHEFSIEQIINRINDINRENQNLRVHQHKIQSLEQIRTLLSGCQNPIEDQDSKMVIAKIWDIVSRG